MIDLRLGDYLETLGDVRANAIITDPPFSERTHKCHDSNSGIGKDGFTRRNLHYSAWSSGHAEQFALWCSNHCTGWIVIMTDDVLAPYYAHALEECGRYVFAPLVLYQPGSRVRLTGDGPSCWVTWIVVARPRTVEYSRWGTLPGGYTGRNDRQYVGGKPLSVMRALVRDYSRPGDLVCDPCAGLGTTLAAAAAEGRRAVGCEIDPEAHARAKARIEMATRQQEMKL